MAAGPRDTMPSGKGRGLLQPPPPPPAVTRPRFMASTLAAAPPPVFHESNAEALSLRARTKGLLTTSVVPGILSSSTGRPDVYSMNRRAPELVVTPYTAAHGFRERRATGLQDEHCTALPRSAQMLSTVAEFLTTRLRARGSRHRAATRPAGKLERFLMERILEVSPGDRERFVRSLCSGAGPPSSATLPAVRVQGTVPGRDGGGGGGGSGGGGTGSGGGKAHAATKPDSAGVPTTGEDGWSPLLMLLARHRPPYSRATQYVKALWLREDVLAQEEASTSKDASSGGATGPAGSTREPGRLNGPGVTFGFDSQQLQRLHVRSRRWARELVRYLRSRLPELADDYTGAGATAVAPSPVAKPTASAAQKRERWAAGSAGAGIKRGRQSSIASVDDATDNVPPLKRRREGSFSALASTMARPGRTAPADHAPPPQRHAQRPLPRTAPASSLPQHKSQPPLPVGDDASAGFAPPAVAGAVPATSTPQFHVPPPALFTFSAPASSVAGPGSAPSVMPARRQRLGSDHSVDSDTEGLGFSGGRAPALHRRPRAASGHSDAGRGRARRFGHLRRRVVGNRVLDQWLYVCGMMRWHYSCGIVDREVVLVGVSRVVEALLGGVRLSCLDPPPPPPPATSGTGTGTGGSGSGSGGGVTASPPTPGFSPQLVSYVLPQLACFLPDIATSLAPLQCFMRAATSACLRLLANEASPTPPTSAGVAASAGSGAAGAGATHAGASTRAPAPGPQPPKTADDRRRDVELAAVEELRKQLRAILRYALLAVPDMLVPPTTAPCAATLPPSSDASSRRGAKGAASRGGEQAGAGASAQGGASSTTAQPQQKKAAKRMSKAAIAAKAQRLAHSAQRRANLGSPFLVHWPRLLLHFVCDDPCVAVQRRCWRAEWNVRRRSMWLTVLVRGMRVCCACVCVRARACVCWWVYCHEGSRRVSLRRKARPSSLAAMQCSA